MTFTLNSINAVAAFDAEDEVQYWLTFGVVLRSTKLAA